MKTTIKIEVTADQLIEFVLNARPSICKIGTVEGQKVLLLDGTEKPFELKGTQKAATVVFDIT